MSEEVPLQSTSGRARVSNTRRDAVAAAVVIAVALLAIWMGHTAASRSIRAWFGGADRTRRLAKALGNRPIKARLAGGFSYAPFQEADENERNTRPTSGSPRPKSGARPSTHLTHRTFMPEEKRSC